MAQMTNPRNQGVYCMALWKGVNILSSFHFDGRRGAGEGANRAFSIVEAVISSGPVVGAAGKEADISSGSFVGAAGVEADISSGSVVGAAGEETYRPSSSVVGGSGGEADGAAGG